MDASVLVSLFLNDALSERAQVFIRSQSPEAIVSDLAAAEFSSVLARRFRARENTELEVRHAFQSFDRWVETIAESVACETSDLRQADRFLRRLDLPLRAPDAIHIATAQRIGAQLASFDAQMVASARALGVAVAAS